MDGMMDWFDDCINEWIYEWVYCLMDRMISVGWMDE
jgi:hypothetical protein